ncbi:ABC transporter substrate-binding protein [Thiomicrorhabdus sediminis]|nr:ABC transporter substrate-binding protein [Thiomicrorhabdus sediminis]
MAFNRRTLIKQVSAFSLTSALASTALISGCQKPSNSRQILVGINGRARMLDPRKATDALSSRINRLLYRQLIDFDSRFQPIPDLAEWQQLSAKHYRFSLIDESFFPDGEQLNAEDVAATYRSVLDKGLGSAHRGSLKHIRAIEVINDKQLDFYLSHEDALFVGRLVIGILPAKMIAQNHQFQALPIGSGACEFIAMSEQKLQLKRRSDGVELAFIPVKDATVRVLKLKKGELDIIQNDLSPELVQYAAKQPQLQVDYHYGTGFGYIGFNFEDPLLSQLALRQAIAHGIDRQAVIDAVFSGRARLAGGLLVPKHWCGVEDMPQYDYNPSLARQLIKQVIEQIKKRSEIRPELAGLIKKSQSGQEVIELSYKTSNDPTRIRLATIYQSQLKPLGIHLKIQSYDWGTFYNDIKQGRFQLYSLAWVGVKSPDIFQYVFASNAIPPQGANRGRYRDQLADDLIAQASQTEDLAEQAKLYKRLQKRLQATLAAMPLWYEDQYAVSRNNISGYQLYADGRLDGLLRVQKN